MIAKSIQMHRVGGEKGRTMDIHHPASPGRNGPENSVDRSLKASLAGKVCKILGFDLNKITKKGQPGFTIFSKVLRVEAGVRGMMSMIQRINIKQNLT